MSCSVKDIVFKAENLNLGYKIGKKGSKLVLENVNFEMKTAQLITLIGANGAGKSTLIKTLCGFLEPLSGQLLFENSQIYDFSKKELSKKIGVVLTERNSEGGFTVFELVSLGRYPYTNFFGKLSSEDVEIVLKAIESVGITHLKDRFVSELSDGERQKAVIAKSIAQQCPVIILDEPTAFLDLKSKVEITTLLRNIAIKENKCVIMSSHDLELSLQMSDKLFLISKNSPVRFGATEDLVLDGKLSDIFGQNNNSVEFDSSIGMFKSIKRSTLCVRTRGEKIPLFWLNNALYRNGFTPIEGDSEHEITVNSAVSFSVRLSDGVHECSSVEAVIEMLKNAKIK